MNKIKKVTEVNNNFVLVNNDELMAGFYINYANPILSLYGVSKINKNEEKLSGFASKLECSYTNGKLLDKNGVEIDDNYALKIVSDDMGEIAEKAKVNSTDDNSLLLLGWVKEFLADLVSKYKKTAETRMPEMEIPMTVEDLAAKLFGNSEEEHKGMGK